MDNNNPLQKFFLYARKSTDVEDKQILSIEAQLAELREYIKRESISVIEELIEKQSAKIPGRPIFNSMIERIEKGEANGIVSWNPDRLARNSIDGGRIIYLIDIGKLQSLKFPTHWFEPTPQGKFMLNIAFGQSKYFVDSLAENTKRGLRQKVRRGEMPGIAPIGYINNSRTKTIVLNKKKAPIIRKVFEMFATGKYLIRDMSDFLAKNGIISKNGRPYKTDRVSYLILKNPFYYGHFRFKGEIFEGIHEPVISKKLFDAVQEVLNKRPIPWRHAKIKRISKPFLGLFRCGECGMMITGELQKGHIYYRCTKKSKTIKCSQPYTREEDLDSQLSDLIQKVSLWEDWKDKMIKKINEEQIVIFQSSRAFVQKTREEIRQINDKLQFLTDAYVDQDIERNVYLFKKSELLSEKKKLEEKIITFEQTQNAWLEPMRSWVKEAADAVNIARGTDLSAKKVLGQKIFGSNLTLLGKIAVGEALSPWAALCAAPTSREWERAKGIEPSVSSLARKHFTGKLRPQNNFLTEIFCVNAYICKCLRGKNRQILFCALFTAKFELFLQNVKLRRSPSTSLGVAPPLFFAAAIFLFRFREKDLLFTFEFYSYSFYCLSI